MRVCSWLNNSDENSSSVQNKDTTNYKQLFCHHLIKQFDEGVGTDSRSKINVKEAIEFIVAA
ncbi:5738_t:CDS:2 [Paraglomus brasilianum]|uniref:5738_t:CDS:1 n=1 Tax=Paraglomus brasilianum TaxID=144538 RepID=A0A9N9CXV8_9GLOM|nr:5738_t:CDS:2 [Paraglomus brasilianum]